MSKFHRSQSAFSATTALAAGLLLIGTVSAQTVQVMGSSPTASYKSEKMAALKAAAPARSQLNPDALGDFSRDNVYTAITPCRIVDTRVAGGIFPGGAIRTYDVDGPNFAAQGGTNGSCNIPFNVASSVAMTITGAGSSGSGYITAWGLGTQPVSSVLNWFTGQVTANTTIVPVVPGVGNDFSIFSSATTEVIIDVVGYFSAPAPTSHTVAALAGTWTAALTGFTGCGSSAMHITYTLNAAGSGTGTLTTHGSCGNSVLANQTFTINSLAANGSGTAGLSCGAGCGWNLRLQTSPDRQVMNLVDVDPANPGNYIGGTAVRQ